MLTEVGLSIQGSLDVLSIPLDGSITESGYFVRDITGLAPVAAEIATSSYALLDGGEFQNARVPTRNIVLKLGYKPDWSLASDFAVSRRNLYRYAYPKANVRLSFTSDDGFPQVIAVGYVESMETNTFSKKGEIAISIICTDPYFNKPTESSTSLSTISADVYRIGAVDLEGDVPQGLRMSVLLKTGVGIMTLLVSNTMFGSQELKIDTPFVSGQTFNLSTVVGDKRAWRTGTSPGNAINTINKTDVFKKWPMLAPGHNALSLRGTVVPNAPTIYWTGKYRGL